MSGLTVSEVNGWREQSSERRDSRLLRRRLLRQLQLRRLPRRAYHHPHASHSSVARSRRQIHVGSSAVNVSVKI
jgi:hypothetical protein